MSSANTFDEAGQMNDGHEVKESINKTSASANSGSQQAGNMLLESESHYRLLVENANEAILVACDGMFRYVNPKTSEITGYSREELMSKPFLDFIHPDDRNMISERHARRLKGEQIPAVYPFRAIDKYGNTKWMEISAVLITWEGKPATLNFVNDITDHRLAEEALREEKERFRALVETTSDWIWEIDANGNYTYASPKVKELLGYEPREVIGKTPFDFMPPEETKRVSNEFAAIVKSGDSFCSLENRNLHKNGQEVVLETSGVPIFDNQRKLKGYRGIDRDITERKRAEEALQKSEARYRLLIENANEAVVVICEGRICFVNPKTIDMSGYTREELISKRFVDLIRLEDREKAIELYQRTIRNEPFPDGYSIIFVDKFGNNKWVEVNSVSITWGDKPATLNFVNDITERKKAEEALKQSEEKLRAMFESVADGIAVTDMEGIILETNEAAVRNFGGSKEGLVGRNGFELVAPQELARSIEDFETILREGHIGTRQYSFLRADGTDYPAEVNVSLIRDDNGKLVGAICISRDITERRRMEDALSKSEAEYRLLVENANEAIVVVCDNMVSFANPKAVEISGYSREELMSMTFIDSVHLDDREIVLKYHLQILSGKQIYGPYAVRTIDKNGDIKWVEVNAVLITWEGKPATLNFANDITIRKKAEEEVKRSRAALRRLSAHLQTVMEGERKYLAHEIHDELGQQLTALKMDLSWIGKNLQNRGASIEKIGTMSKSIDTTIDMVRKISADLRPAILDDFGLLAAIESYLGEFQRRTGIKCAIAPRSRDVDLGQGRNVALFRIVQEALTNVTRHANATEVEVSLKKRNGSILLQIKDNGRGVRDEELASSKSIGIVGMRERARLCKGQMRIRGIVGKGTTVRVNIPIKEEKLDDDDISG